MSAAKKLRFLLVIVTASCALCEGTTRLLGFYGVNLSFKPVTDSPTLRWKLKDNCHAMWEQLEWKLSYVTNSRGFQDRLTSSLAAALFNPAFLSTSLWSVVRPFSMKRPPIDQRSKLRRQVWH